MKESMTPMAALDVLGLAPGDSQADVTRAYRQSIAAVHPDLASDEHDREQRGQRAARVNLAYELLTRVGTGVQQWGAEPPSEAASTFDVHNGGGRREEAAPPEVREQPARHDQGPARTARARAAVWFAAISSVFVLLGAVLRLLHFWDELLEPTAWGDGGASLGLMAIGLRAVLGLLATWFIGHAGARPAAITLAFAAVFYSSFSEVSIRLNWAEESLIFGGVVLVPLYFLVGTVVRRRMGNP